MASGLKVIAALGAIAAGAAAIFAFKKHKAVSYTHLTLPTKLEV